MEGQHTPLYKLSIVDIAARHLEVQISLDGPFDRRLRLWMPAWVPGSYLLREYAGHVIRLDAFNGESPLACQKTDKSSWEVDTKGASSLRVVYRVFAPELTVRTNDITDQHAFVNPAGTFLAIEGLEERPARLEVICPKGWSVHTALPGDGKNVFEVADFDTLVDSPLEMGTMPVQEFTVAGVKHQLVIEGEGNYDLGAMLKDMAAIVAEESKIFGGLPPDLKRYLFILLLTENGMGGLEHCMSTALAWPRLGFRPEIEYHRFLTLIAHEYFHIWNVKRIRPELFLNYDYRRETHTRLLWAFEGVTNYYDELVPMRAGVYGVKRYLEFTAENIRAEWARPGNQVQSVSDSSFDTWIKLYRPSIDGQNSQVSYYQRGMLVALLLDLELRRRSGDEKSLDHVMRYLWSKVYAAGEGVAEGSYHEIVKAATGIDVKELLDEYIEGTKKLDYEEALAHVGLKIEKKPLEGEEVESAWLGASVQVKEGRSVLSSVLRGGSAHAAGLMAEDVIVALNDLEVTSDLEKRLKLYRPQETVRWHAFRHGRLVHGTMKFLENPYPPMRLVAVENRTEAQRKSFLAWAGREYEPKS